MRFAAILLSALLLWPVAARTDTTIARQAILIDATTGTVLLEKAADTPMPTASMSKLMTVFMVFERLKQGRLALDQTFPVSRKAWRMGGSKTWVEVDTDVTVGDLLRGVIVQSGNDASIVLAEGISGSEEAFAEAMTARARELGLENSSFRNATGMPDPGHAMSARDLARLAARIVEEFPEHYPMFSEREFIFSGIRQPNRNPLLDKGLGVDGLKTGHTEEAGYGLVASAERAGRRLYLVVGGLPDARTRAREAQRLIEWGFRDFSSYELFKAGETVESVPVWHGSEAIMPLVVDEDIAVTLKRQARAGLQVRIVHSSPLIAPVAKGSEVGTLRIEASGRRVREVPLRAGLDAVRLGFFGRVGARLGDMFLP